MDKTCGNCNLADFDLMRCDYFDDNGEHEAITKNKPACEDWIKRALTDEQRYQQLEEVARDLWQYIADRAPNMPQSVFILGQTAEQLEKLGVMVDD